MLQFFFFELHVTLQDKIKSAFQLLLYWFYNIHVLQTHTPPVNIQQLNINQETYCVLYACMYYF